MWWYALAGSSVHTRVRYVCTGVLVFFFSSRRRHTRFKCDWSSDVCSSDLNCDAAAQLPQAGRKIDQLLGDDMHDDALALQPADAAEQRGAEGSAPVGIEDCEIGRASCRERG